MVLNETRDFLWQPRVMFGKQALEEDKGPFLEKINHRNH